MEIPPYSVITDMIHQKMNELRINQVQLAEDLDFSSAQLSRIINEETNPSYSKVSQIWQLLKSREARQKVPVKELMQPDITWVQKSERRQDAVDKMTKNDFSQLPVQESGEAIGIITDFDLMRHQDHELMISDIVHRNVIEIGPEDSRELAISILEEDHSAILVRESNSYEGIISKFDLL